MEALQHIRASGTLLALVLIPQLIGGWMLIAGSRRGLHWLSSAAAIVIPPTLYYLVVASFWSRAASEAIAAGERLCGAAGAMSFISTVGGAAIHFIAAIAVVSIHASLSGRKRNAIS